MMEIAKCKSLTRVLLGALVVLASVVSLAPQAGADTPNRTQPIRLPEELDDGVRMLERGIEPTGKAIQSISGVNDRLRQAIDAHKQDPNAMPPSELLLILSEECPKIVSSCRDILKAQPDIDEGVRLVIGGLQTTERNLEVTIDAVAKRCERRLAEAVDLKEKVLPELARSLAKMDKNDKGYDVMRREFQRQDMRYRNHVFLAKFYAAVLKTYKTIGQAINSYGGTIEHVTEISDQLFLTVESTKELVSDVVALNQEAAAWLHNIEQLVGDSGHLRILVGQAKDVMVRVNEMKEVLEIVQSMLTENESLLGAVAELEVDPLAPAEKGPDGSTKTITLDDRIEAWRKR